MANETPVTAKLIMDRSQPLGNSVGDDARRRLHVKVANGSAEAIPVKITGSSDGNTIHLNGTVNTTTALTPAVAGNIVMDVMAQNVDTAKDLFVSFDGGTTFKTLRPGDNWIWSPKGNLTQFHIKGENPSTSYEIVINTE